MFFLLFIKHIFKTFEIFSGEFMDNFELGISLRETVWIAMTVHTMRRQWRCVYIPIKKQSSHQYIASLTMKGVSYKTGYTYRL